MRPNSLPYSSDVPEGVDVDSCVAAAELLLGCALRPRRMSTEALLGGLRKQFVLDWHPVRGVRLDGAHPNRSWWAELEFGLVGTSSLPASSYTVDFLVGYEEGSVPVIYCELVRLVALFLEGEVEAEEVLGVARAARGMRVSIEQTRANYRRN